MTTTNWSDSRSVPQMVFGSGNLPRGAPLSASSGIERSRRPDRPEYLDLTILLQDHLTASRYRQTHPLHPRAAQAACDVMHDVKAVEAADTLDGPAVGAKMRESPVNDRFTWASGGLVFGPRAASSSRATPRRSAAGRRRIGGYRSATAGAWARQAHAITNYELP